MNVGGDLLIQAVTVGREGDSERLYRQLPELLALPRPLTDGALDSHTCVNRKLRLVDLCALGWYFSGRRWLLMDHARFAAGCAAARAERVLSRWSTRHSLPEAVHCGWRLSRHRKVEISWFRPAAISWVFPTHPGAS